jgi:hypothetical protein
MTPVMDDDDMTLNTARQQLGLSVLDLWIAYFAIGGLSDAPTLESYLHGQSTAPNTEHNLIAHALNERFSELNMDTPVPYRGI